MYLTYTGQTLSAQVGAAHAVTADIAALSHALLRFIHTPDRSAGLEAEAMLHRLAHMPLFQQDLHTLVAHGRLIVERLPQVDALVRQIIAAPTAAHAEALHQAVLQYATRAEARAQWFRVLLYLVAVILLGYLCYQFARLRAHARDLRRTNADLQREMGERQQAVAALRASEERFRAITESANDAIISADSTGHIRLLERPGRGHFRLHGGGNAGRSPHAPDACTLPGGPRAWFYAVGSYWRCAPGRHDG
jgi:PAS domain-containing protein